MQLSSKFDGVLARGVGKVINELHARVGTLDLGPVKAPQFLWEDIEGKNVDPRQATVERVGNSRIQSVCARDVRGVVVGKGRLVQAVVPKTGFVDPMWAGHPGPVLAENLGARVDLREPFRLQLTGVGNRTGIVAE